MKNKALNITISTAVLSAFGAHIFFDDQKLHVASASEVVPSAVVPYREGDDPRV